MGRRISLAAAFLAVLAAPLGRAEAAEVTIRVDKTTQRMTVSVDGTERYVWPVSTGLGDYSTPTGTYAPSRLARQHYSREWDDAPMPHSIFFTDAGHAIHGSNAVARLGTPASHGCIRLAPRNAGTLFDLVAAEGIGNTRIDITGFDPIGSGLASGSGATGDYSRLTSFNPLTDGIMAGSPGTRRAADARR